MKAVLIGPGRIGCGFAGQMLKASGWEVVFAARRQEVVEHLNRVGRYKVCLIDGPHRSEIVVDGVRAVWTGDLRRVVGEMADADVIGTAVGAGNLVAVAPLIAAGLARRGHPANVLAFENLGQAGSRLRALVATNLTDGAVDAHGFSGVLISRVVTQRLGDPSDDEPFVFIGDSPSTFVVDGLSLRHPHPQIHGLVVADDYEAWIRRKLYMFSAGHAATAYLGYLKGYHYIHTAIRDPEIRESVLQAMAEGQRGLARRYGPEIAGAERDLLKIVARFENAGLNDPIVRVGRDPRRKLGSEDRLVGAARLAERAGVSPKSLSLAVAAALCFCSSQHLSAEEVLREIQIADAGPVLTEVDGLDSNRRLGSLVAETWKRLAEGWHRDNLLLSLDGLMWAWTAEGAEKKEVVRT